MIVILTGTVLAYWVMDGVTDLDRGVLGILNNNPENAVAPTGRMISGLFSALDDLEIASAYDDCRCVWHQQ